MTPFWWRALVALGVIVIMFVVTTVTMTLVLVAEVRDNDINDAILTYVEIANWVMVGTIGLVIVALIFTTPYFVAYTRRYESLVSTGLRSAKEPNRVLATK